MLTGVRPPTCFPDMPSTGESVCLPGQQNSTGATPPQRGLATSSAEPAPSVPSVPLGPEQDADFLDTVMQPLVAAPPWAVITVIALILLVLILLWTLLRGERGKHAPKGAQGGILEAPKQEHPHYSDLVSGLIGAHDLSESDVVKAHVEKTLRGVGIRMVIPASGDPFDTTVHNGISGVPTPNPALAFHIARVLRPGWRSPEGVLRPADVEVYKE